MATAWLHFYLIALYENKQGNKELVLKERNVWIFNSVGLVYLLGERKNPNIHTTQQEEEIFFLLEVCCENSDAGWQTKSFCIQGTKNNSQQWLRSCRVAGVVKKEKN